MFCPASPDSDGDFSRQTLQQDAGNITRQREFGKLLSAILTTQQFAELLLQDPSTALERGYMGCGFQFDPEDVAAITDIRVESVQELLDALIAIFSTSRTR